MCRIKPLVAAFYCIIPCPGLIVFLCQQNNRNIQSCDTLTSVPEWQGKNYNHDKIGIIDEGLSFEHSNIKKSNVQNYSGSNETHGDLS